MKYSLIVSVGVGVEKMWGEMNDFVYAWDILESAHPFGVDHYTPFFRDFDIPVELCEYVDRNLYLDMMIPRQVDVRRLKVERRQSNTVSWVYVEILSPSTVGVAFQATPTSSFNFVIAVEATPRALIEALVLYHGRSLISPRVPCMKPQLCQKRHRAV